MTQGIPTATGSVTEGGQASFITSNTGGIYVAYVDAAELGDRLEEVIVGAVVRGRTEFVRTVFRPTDAIAPYIVVEPSEIVAPAGTFGPGDYPFRITRRTLPKPAAHDCGCGAGGRVMRKLVEGGVDVVVDGGIVGQVQVQVCVLVEKHADHCAGRKLCHSPRTRVHHR